MIIGGKTDFRCIKKKSEIFVHKKIVVAIKRTEKQQRTKDDHKNKREKQRHIWCTCVRALVRNYY